MLLLAYFLPKTIALVDHSHVEQAHMRHIFYECHLERISLQPLEKPRERKVIDSICTCLFLRPLCDFHMRTWIW
jgi:hypothetical protein